MSKLAKDHLGNEFTSTTEMCNAYDISRSAYLRRVSRGWSQEAALTTPVNENYNSKKEPLSPEEQKAILSAYGKEYRDKNVESERARRKEYKDTHRDEENAKRRAYYDANVDKEKEYRDANKEKAKAYQKVYREERKQENK